jgi:serine/threonine protein kinase
LFCWSEVLNPPKEPSPGAKAVSGFAADVYSFGVVVWEIATGETPFEGKLYNEIMLMVGFEKQWLPIPEKVIPVMANIMERCWHRDPELRVTMEELFHEFDTSGRAS